MDRKINYKESYHDIVMCNRFFLQICNSNYQSAILLTYLDIGTPLSPENQLSKTTSLTTNQIRHAKQKLIELELLYTDTPNKTKPKYYLNSTKLQELYIQHYPETDVQNITLADDPKNTSNPLNDSDNPTHKPDISVNPNSVTFNKYNTLNNPTHKPDTRTSSLLQGGTKQTKNTTIQYMLAELLFNLIQKNKPNYFGALILPENSKQKHKRIYHWSEEIRKMIKCDGYTEDEILDMIQWTQDHDFWKNNILSGGKLRKQFPRLQEQKHVWELMVAKAKDEHPELTLDIQTRFRKAFLYGREVNWNLTEKGHFAEASRKAVKLANETNLRLENIPELLIDCLKRWKLDTDFTLWAGNASSTHTWEILLPQYLKSSGISLRDKETV